jgi:Leucine-rich repeat (LRR) protein
MSTPTVSRSSPTRGDFVLPGAMPSRTRSISRAVSASSLDVDVTRSLVDEKSCLNHFWQILKPILKRLEVRDGDRFEVPDDIDDDHIMISIFLQNHTTKGYLARIEELNLSKDNEILEDPKMCILPKEIRLFTGLKFLNLANNSLKNLPEVISSLSLLENINLSNNTFSNFPIQLLRLTSLLSLNLSMNSIEMLPPGIFVLNRLRELILSHNNLITIPSGIGSMISLVTLDLSYNKIIHFPIAMGRPQPRQRYAFPNIFDFYINNNRLEDLPHTFENFPYIEDFKFESNAWEKLPAVITRMEFRGFGPRTAFRRIELEDEAAAMRACGGCCCRKRVYKA